MRIVRCIAVLSGLALCAHARRVDVTLLATTDLHGNLYPYDYFNAEPAPRGLAKIATLIERTRAANPNTVLVDCGDVIQGTPLEYVYQTYVRSGHLPLTLKFPGPPLARDPMMTSMSLLKYDAMVLGNHEFNYGLKNLARARSQASFPWISANTVVQPGAAVQPFIPYIVKTVGGVKIGIVGITTPLIPIWEIPENYRGVRFLPGVEAARNAVAKLRSTEHPDIVIVAGHTGLDRDLRTGTVHPEDSEENMIYEIAERVQGIDAVVFGHTHLELAEAHVGNVILMQPKNWGISLGRMDFELDGEPGGWKIVSKHSNLLPVTTNTPVDQRIVEIARPYHELAEAYLNTPVAEAPAGLDAHFARVEDTAILDAVQQVEMHYANADVSFASAFNTNLMIRKGPVTVRQIAALYIYDNELYALEGTGKMLREALENAARYFKSCAGAICGKEKLINPEVLGFNFDVASGVEYEIDLTQPEGHRLRNLRRNGRPVGDGDKLRIALNNYRAGGSAGYTMFRGAKILWRSSDEIRDLMIRYYTERKRLPERADNNWRIEPEEAREKLRREAAAAGAPRNQ